MSNLMHQELSTSRRTFLKAALAGGVGLAGLSALNLSQRQSAYAVESADDIAWDAETDVLVCGCGTGGTPAAIEAYDAGADVLIIEKKNWIGGSMRRCGGAMMGAGTVVQEALGVEDDPEMLYEYLLACGEGLSDPNLVRILADNAGKNIDWVINDLGGQPVDEWDFATPDDEGAEICIKPGLNVSGTPVSYADFGMPEYERQRCHWFTENPEDQDPGDRFYSDYSSRGDGTWKGRGGTGLWKPFENALTERGIEVMTETTLKHLVVDGNGAVVGVVAEQDGNDIYLKANRAVVLATGGFARNEEMLHDYRAAAFEEPDEVAMRGGNPAPGECDGAALLAAFEIGAAATSLPAANGGLKINTNAQVIDVFGEPIPGLFASSKAIGGVYGNIYPLCGSFISAFICFGRIAGQNAAACTADNKVIEGGIFANAADKLACKIEKVEVVKEAPKAEAAKDDKAGADAEQPAEAKEEVDCAPCHGDNHTFGDENPHGY